MSDFRADEQPLTNGNGIFMVVLGNDTIVQNECNYDNTVVSVPVSCFAENSEYTITLYYSGENSSGFFTDSDNSFTVGRHTHSLLPEYSFNETEHWRICSECKEKVDPEPHTEYGGTVTVQPTETTEGIRTFSCIKCGYDIL